MERCSLSLCYSIYWSITAVSGISKQLSNSVEAIKLLRYQLINRVILCSVTHSINYSPHCANLLICRTSRASSAPQHRQELTLPNAPVIDSNKTWQNSINGRRAGAGNLHKLHVVTLPWGCWWVLHHMIYVTILFWFFHQYDCNLNAAVYL